MEDEHVNHFEMSLVQSILLTLTCIIVGATLAFKYNALLGLVVGLLCFEVFVRIPWKLCNSMFVMMLVTPQQLKEIEEEMEDGTRD